MAVLPTKDKAETLNSYFQSLFTHVLQNDLILSVSFNYERDNREVKICPKGVLKLLGSLQTTKSCGSDFIMAKCCTAKSIEACPCCSNLKKNRSKQLTKNHRPISLTSIRCKLLEYIVHSIISDHLESEGILTDAQHGFRAKRSGEIQLVSTIHDLTQRFEKGETIDVLILDFAKAFYTVSHNLLF